MSVSYTTPNTQMSNYLLSSNQMLLVSYLIRNFIPMNPFYINFLVETKEFTNLEVSSSITPYYFLSSFFTMFVCKQILLFFGLKYCSVIFTALLVLNTICFLNLPKRSFIGARLVYLTSGFIFTFETIYRFYLSEQIASNNSTDNNFAKMQLWRAAITSLSAVVGEEIVRKSKFYEINIYISILMQILSCMLSIYNATRSKKEAALGDADMFDSLSNINSNLFCALCSGVICGCISLILRLFANSIFRDKSLASKSTKKDVNYNEVNINNQIETSASIIAMNSDGDDKYTTANESSVIDKYTTANESSVIDLDTKQLDPDNKPTAVGESPVAVEIEQAGQLDSTGIASNWLSLATHIRNILAIPIIVIANILIFVVGFIFPAYRGTGNAQKAYLNGYLDAVLNIMCYAVPVWITNHFQEIHQKEFLSILFLFISSLVIILTVKQERRIMVSLFYIIVGISTRSCSALTKKLLKIDMVDNNLIILGYFIESILHIVVNYGSKFFKANAVAKAKIYGSIGLVFFTIIIGIKIFNKSY